jgi:hypothetical protein
MIVSAKVPLGAFRIQIWVRLQNGTQYGFQVGRIVQEPHVGILNAWRWWMPRIIADSYFRFG